MLVLIATSPKNLISHTVKCVRKKIKLRGIKQKINYTYRTNFYAKFKLRISLNFFTQLICFIIKHSVPSTHYPKHKNNFKFSSNFIGHEFRNFRILVCPLLIDLSSEYSFIHRTDEKIKRSPHFLQRLILKRIQSNLICFLEIVTYSCKSILLQVFYHTNDQILANFSINFLN